MPLVSISNDQRTPVPNANFAATVHHGVASFASLTLVKPGSYQLSALVPGLYTGPNSAVFTVAPLQVLPSVLQLKPTTGVFTAVGGVIQAVLTVPAGWKLDVGPVGLGDPTIGNVVMTTPLTTRIFTAASTALSADGTTLVAAFNKADIDNNIPEGDAVPLTLNVTVLQNGAQKQLTSTVNVKVTK